MPASIGTAQTPYVDILPDRDGEAYVGFRSDGSIDTNFEWGSKGELKNKIVGELDRKAEVRDELLELAGQVEDTNPELAEQLRGEAKEIDNLFANVKLLAQSSTTMPMGLEILDKFDGGPARDLVKIGGEFVATRGEQFNNLMGPPLKEFLTPQLLGTIEGGATETKFGKYTKSEWKEMIRKDPNAAAEAMKEMDDPNLVQMLYQSLQRDLQIENQLATFLSNFQKASHDTQKAILANLRV